MMTQLPTTETTVMSKPKRQPRGIQPKFHAPKTRAASALRRKKIIKDILAGKPRAQAGIDSGLNPTSAASQVSQILQEPKVLESLNAAMERVGMDEQSLALQLKKLILGTKLIPATIINLASGSKESGYVEVPDYNAKARGLNLAYKLLGYFRHKTNIEVKPQVKIVIREEFCSGDQREGAESAV
jgi:hypothetical protein